MEVRVIGGVITPQCIVAIPKQNVNKNYLTSVNKSKLRKEKFAPFVTQGNVSIVPGLIKKKDFDKKGDAKTYFTYCSYCCLS